MLIEEVKELCRELGEEGLITTIDSFVSLNRELEGKRGNEFVEIAVLGFLEGILTTLKIRHEDGRIDALLGKVRARREELEALFRRSRSPLTEV
ncbi:DUF3216 domain-containing protein [Pyrococcus yayanosii]|uniref:DUF3216 domain-containing protein n=1 Tax=Pyrococcus yayanosii (strain CH1 / JCM 16557) TaxID=529709 RepID=F8AIJ1_PYRYC|nr:DUF3216 domain-containing protein [Pyrococcus yayanosii]AEH24357.1 hypothetical protein PYCH_06690 [Pyrococcus yayanosii CH1]